MSTQERLDNYLAAEARILQRGFSLQFEARRRQEAALADIQKAIRQLKAELAAEQGVAPSSGSLRYKTVVFNGR